MEESKEEKKKSKISVVAILICFLVGFAVGYFLSVNYSNDNTTNENNTSVDNNEVVPCKYEKLKDASQLTDDEKFEINEHIIEFANIHVNGDWKSINDYMYSIKFAVGGWEDGEDGTVDYVIVWRENNQWNRSEYFSSEDELMKNLPNIDTCK